MFKPITTHATDAVGRLLWQFQDKADPKALLTILGAEIQAIENAFDQLIAILNPALQTGDALGRIGHTVGLLSQGGLSDANFRTLIQTQIDINKSKATNADILTAARAIASSQGMDPTHLDINESGAGESYQPSGGMLLYDKPALDGTGALTEVITQAAARAIWRAAKAAASAGVRVLVGYRPVGVSGSGAAFRFAGGGSGGVEPSSGFSVGKLCGVVSSEN